MMTCPDCDAREAFSTVKCACGYMFPLEVRKREERRLGHEKEKLQATLVRYPALRITAQIYRVFAVIAGLIGVGRLITNLVAAWPSGDPSKVTLSGWMLVAELIAAGLAVVTSLAVSEGIAVLAEINDRRAEYEAR
jgi:hypothetical protein